MSKWSDTWDFTKNKINKQKIAWYILDELAVEHGAFCGGSIPPHKEYPKPLACPICDRAIEAMELLEKPTHEECQQLYHRRKGLLVNYGPGKA